jgi:hypothetical protein
MNAVKHIHWMDPQAASATLLRVDDGERWQRIVNGFRDHNYRQGWTYGAESADRYNARIERMAIRVGTEIVGAALVRLKTIPFLKGGMAYVGGGPLTRRDRDDDMLSLRLCLDALRREYIDLRGYMLRILPPLDPTGNSDAITECFRDSHFDPSPWPPPFRTIVVNIDRPLPDIRKTLAQKWRNCLNNAEKRGITVKSGNDVELFELFDQIHDRFMDRKAISVDVGADFYTDIRSRGGENEGYYVNIAFVDDQPVSGQLCSMLGDTGVTLLAATGDAGLKCKASNLLQWDSIVEAHRRGMRWFDLGGIDPEGQPGVYHFKSGLGGIETDNAGPFQSLPRGMMGSVTPAVERLYRWSRRHRLRA